jgi:hypothetical protein
VYLLGQGRALPTELFPHFFFTPQYLMLFPQMRVQN